MIKFKDVTYSNIMSVGNTPITVDLSEFNKTLITGTNGAGKSTFIEAVCFALYGKPFRNIKKTQIVNAVNKKKLLVEITFQDNKHVYKIIRGIKPNKFEIYKDDELIPQEAAVADYQDMLEKNILKMSLSTFKQIAVLGTAGYTPFMLLPAGKRREIVEDLLDIGIFSDMAALNKVALKQLNEKIKDTEAEIERRMGELKLHIQFQKEQQDNRDGDLAQLEARKKEAEAELVPIGIAIAELENQISGDSKILRDLKQKLDFELSAAEEEHETELAALDSEHRANINEIESKQKEELDELKAKQTSEQNVIDELNEQEVLDLDKEHSQELIDFDKETEKNTPEAPDADAIAADTSTVLSNKKEIAKLKENKEFFEKNGDCECSTCKQTISSDFAQSVIDMADSQIATLTEESKALAEKIRAAQAQSKARSEYISTRASERSDLDEKQRTERSVLVKKQSEKRAEVIEAQREEMSKKTSIFNDTLTLLREEQSKARAESVAQFADIKASLTDKGASEREELANNIAKDKAELAKAITNEQNLTSKIATINADIEDVKAKAATEDRSALIKKLTAEVREVKAGLQNDLQTKHCRTIVGTLLKDDGVKSMIVRQYIPMINKYINDYLKTMNANYNFVLDEEFNETIKSRGRDDFSYTSFSQGERCRIDLALLFAFRDLVSARTGSMTNLLVLDEVFDSAADTDGVDSINQILSSIQDNVFIISHSEKHEQSMFDKHIKFAKKGNFTREVK
ncbi:exonuclease subunit 2 [Vibrio phage VH7D]|uniref:Exonuclease subunit 2 n=1 Tax=Vibrio phage VH7D TaxID=1262539 RepID=V9LZS8_9CAUD|nr:SbcC-like subunit of palindrome specific endonuclease [Vibrio phage VH7D]AGB07081.1 exonuclease subunit 2 [Vibrio phage VH7D]QNJ54639.1 exonuclease subunit 2 [Vibrio phage vB_ValM_R10Z]QNJ55025.1 exonuclease subunit 2 [Vibrio phage vB_ValM_R11Z]